MKALNIKDYSYIHGCPTAGKTTCLVSIGKDVIDTDWLMFGLNANTGAEDVLRVFGRNIFMDPNNEKELFIVEQCRRLTLAAISMMPKEVMVFGNLFPERKIPNSITFFRKPNFLVDIYNKRWEAGGKKGQKMTLNLATYWYDNWLRNHAMKFDHVVELEDEYMADWFNINISDFSKKRKKEVFNTEMSKHFNFLKIKEKR